MSEFKGTKGEWNREGTIIFVPGGGFDVRHMPDAEENAKLISAAPDLLEALQKLVVEMEITMRVGYERIIDLGGSCDEPQVMIDGHPEIARAKEAIAKALGK